MPNFIDPLRGIIVGQRAFVASDLDDDDDTKYYGFLSSEGTWLIMCEITSSKSFRFFGGHGGYSTAWNNRTVHTYVYYDEIL